MVSNSFLRATRGSVVGLWRYYIAVGVVEFVPLLTRGATLVSWDASAVSPRCSTRLLARAARKFSSELPSRDREEASRQDGFFTAKEKGPADPAAGP